MRSETDSIGPFLEGETTQVSLWPIWKVETVSLGSIKNIKQWLVNQLSWVHRLLWKLGIQISFTLEKLFILELSRLKNPGDFAIFYQLNYQPQLIDKPTKESKINILQQTIITGRDENAIDVGDGLNPTDNQLFILL